MSLVAQSLVLGTWMFLIISIMVYGVKEIARKIKL